MTAFVRDVERRTGRSFADHEAFHRFSIEEPSAFWGALLAWLELDVSGDREPVLSGDTCLSARFFPGLRLSFARNLLQSQEPSDGARPAIVSVDETGARRVRSRDELAREVLAVASALSRRGIGPGDRVVAVVSNVGEAVVACLAAAAVGAAWSSVAPNLGLDATLDRFGQLSPKALFCHTSYRYQGVEHDTAERMLELSGALPSLELVVTLGGGAAPDRAWIPLEALSQEGADGPYRALVDLPSFPFDHPLYVLFSSGTTGRPKCIVHGAGGTLLEHAKEHRLHSDLRPGERLLFQTAAGWMMWNWLVSALASRVTIVLYEGSVTYPTPDALWRVVAEERASVFGTSPGFLQYSREAGLEPRTLELGALRALQSTGSVLADDLFEWAIANVKKVPLQSISGGTDIIGCFLLGHPNLPVYAGELQAKSLGYDVDAFGPDGAPAGAGVVGELVCKAPFPSRPVGLFGDETGERFVAAYFSQNAAGGRVGTVWTHGDLLEFSPSGGARIYGRSDGVLNIRGIRIGPAEIYRALTAGVPEVTEAMAIEQAAPREIGGSRLVLLVVLRAGEALTPELEARIRRELEARCSAAHVPSVILARADLPTTHSGKRSERAARDAVNRRTVANLGALRNPESLEGLDTAPELDLEPSRPVVAIGPSHDVTIPELCAIWSEVLGVAEVRPDDSFFHIGGHSLGAVSLLARVERAYGVRLPMSSLLAKASTPSRMAAVLSGEAERQDTHIVAIRPEGSKVPVFWLPGGGGLSVLAFRDVSWRLGDDQPVYGFEAKLTLDGAPSSIPEIARRYVDDLVQAFPAGPYMLLGFSFGSWVAFEMAVELRRRKREVPLLCVFDSPIPVQRSLRDRGVILAQRAGYHVKNVARLPRNELPGYFRDALEMGGRRAREGLAKLGLDVDPRHTTESSGDSVFDTLDRRNRAAAADYVRGPIPTFDGRVTVVLAERTSQAAVSPELDDRLVIQRHAAGVEIHRLPSAHLTMLEPPEVDRLADVLRGCIARATPPSEVTHTQSPQDRHRPCSDPVRGPATSVSS